MASFSLRFKNGLAYLHVMWLHAWRLFLRPLGALSVRCALILSFVLPNFLVFSSSAVDNLSGTFSAQMKYTNYHGSVYYPWFIDGQDLPLINSFVDYKMVDDQENAVDCGLAYITTSTPAIYGALGVYLTYFYTGYGSTAWSEFGTPSLQVGVYDSSRQQFTLDSSAVSLDTYTPTTSAPYHSTGYRFSVKYDNAGSESNYVQNPVLGFNFDSYRWAIASGHSGVSDYSALVIPSFRIVATNTSAELSELESIADSIAEQNNVLSAMYGDILGVLNSIYSRTGDMLQAQQLANSYFLQAIQYLSHIDSNTQDIYTLLGTQFALLIDTINSGVVDITDAIAAAELRLEQYLKPVIDYFNSLEDTTGESAATLPGHKTDLDAAVSSSSGIDTNAEQGFSVIWSMISQFELLLVCIGMWLGATIFLVVIKKGLS